MNLLGILSYGKYTALKDNIASVGSNVFNREKNQGVTMVTLYAPSIPKAIS